MLKAEDSRGMPFATMQVLHDEHRRLGQMSPALAEAVYSEMMVVLYPDCEPTDYESEIARLEAQIAELQTELDDLQAQLTALDGRDLSPETLAQAEVVQALLRQYEGRESQVLAVILDSQAEALS